MGKEILRQSLTREIEKLKRIDLVVGIPSYNNATTLRNVVEMLGLGLEKYYPGLTALIINADGGSTDGTIDEFDKAVVPDNVVKLTTPYQGIPGKGSALRTIFEVAKLAEVRTCVVTDADTHSIDPEWIKQLGHPVFQYYYGFVTPRYLRDKHDATITNGLIYPLTRALYGLQLRQPIGGDFGLSAGIVHILTHDHYWECYPNINKFGVDIWMTTTAICEGFRITQAALGTKIHEPKQPGKDLLPMFIQVVGTTFDLMARYAIKWKNVRHSVPVEVYGEHQFTEIEDISVSSQPLIDKFNLGYEKFKSRWKAIVNEDDLSTLIKTYEKDYVEFLFPVDLWARIVYDFAVAYNLNRGSRKEQEAILEAMIPLYLARTASYIREMSILSDELADAFIDGCANVFERLKPYLIQKWEEQIGFS